MGGSLPFLTFLKEPIDAAYNDNSNNNEYIQKSFYLELKVEGQTWKGSAAKLSCSWALLEYTLLFITCAQS